ncbi:formylglycine-generating enzyme family protein, partial [Nodularia spumigena]|uniref:formylglycine-generating enzyme family protein n=1 Tax=Nodularia spumigena TaxID=70799 RepID=UPI002B20B4AB
KLRFSGTNDSTKLGEYAWFADKSVGSFDFKEREVGTGSTHPVATKKPNALGIYDLTGNVWEWTSDWYSKNYPTSEKNKPVLNPRGPEKGLARSLRGGSWFSFAYGCRNSNRWFYGNRFPRNDDIGFRCVKDI